MANKGTWAEDYFAALCSGSGAVATQPRADEHGWDYLVELPRKPFDGPAESTPGQPKAFVQIKSTIGRSARCRIKLSIMSYACSSPQPWFVFLIQKDKKTGNCTIYARHIWRDEMENWLAEIRRADIQKKQLHTVYRQFSFSESDRIDGDIVAWMQEKIECAGTDYEAEKKKLYENVGYSDGYGKGKLTIKAASDRELAKALLGLESKVPVKHFSFTQQRFGIDNPLPLVDATDGKLTINPNPISKARIKIKNSLGEPALNLDASIYATNVPLHSGGEHAYRISSPPIELIHYGPMNEEMKLLMDYDVAYPPKFFITYAKVTHWVRHGNVEIHVWKDGKRVYKGRIGTSEDLMSDREIEIIRLVSDILQSSEEGHNPIKISLADIDCSIPDTSYFFQSLARAPMKFTCPIEQELPNHVSHLFYRTTTDIGPGTLRAIAHRKVIHDTIEDGLRVIVAKEPVIIESEASQHATEEQCEAFVAEYEDALDRFSRENDPLAFGDIKEAFQDNKRRQDVLVEQ